MRCPSLTPGTEWTNRVAHLLRILAFSAPARRITDFMTMTSAEILPETMSKKFSFGSRMSSASFGSKPQAKAEEMKVGEAK